MVQSLRLPAPGASLVRHQRFYHVAVSPALIENFPCTAGTLCWVYLQASWAVSPDEIQQT